MEKRRLETVYEESEAPADPPTSLSPPGLEPRLAALVRSHETWLMERILHYARALDYTRYTSTLLEAWRASIVGLSEPLIAMLESAEPPPELACEMDFAGHPASAFGVLEARRHRERGITLGLFLGLFKYYRQTYEDLLDLADLGPVEHRRARRYLSRYFDLVELGFCSEWADISQADAHAELQTTNRRVVNEKNKYLTIFESLDDPVVFLDAHGAIENMNQAAFLAFTDEAVPGAMYYGSASAYVLQQALSAALPAEDDARELELDTRRGPLRFLIRRRRMLDVSEKFRGEVLILRDVTDARAAEAELEHVNAELRRASEAAQAANAAKSSFLAVMSHEIRTPMNAIVGMTQLCARTELTETQRYYVESTRRAADLLLSVIDDVLDFSKIESGHLELESAPLSLDAVLDPIVGIVAHQAEVRRLGFELDCPPDVPTALVGDSVRLGQILLNLCTNAVKFTRAGSVRLSIHAVELGAEQVRLRFGVQDTGIGMDAATVRRVLEPFTQADASTTRTHGGTGLGLAIASQLIERMGGRLEIESTPNVGSNFHFELELSRDTAASALRRGLESVRAVLVATDDSRSADSVEPHLRALGLKLERHASLEALATARATGPFQVCFVHFDALDPERLAPDRPACLVVFGEHRHREAMLASLERGVVDRVLVAPFTGSAVYDAVLGAIGADGRREGLEDDAGGLESRRGAAILVAEDNPIGQVVIRELLEHLEMRPTLCSSGEEALTALQDGDFELVLMDVHMPGIGGLQATARIRARDDLADLPVVALTADATSDGRREYVARGMSDVLLKPVRLEQLRAALVRWLPPAVREPPRPRRARHEDDEALAELGPDVDVQDALERLGGNPRLLRSLLIELGASQAGAPAEIRALIEDGQLARARERTHALKSVVGSLGAVPCQAATTALDDALLRAAPLEELESRLQRFEASFHALLRSTERLARSEPRSPHRAKGPGDAARARALSQTISERVRLSILIDSDELTEFRAAVGRLAPPGLVERVERSILSLDTATALEALGALRGALEDRP